MFAARLCLHAPHRRWLFGADCHVPVDLVGCERPGVAADRMATLRALVQPGLDRRRLLTPGHVFPTAVGECHSVDDAWSPA